MFSIVFNGDIADFASDASNQYKDLQYKLEKSNTNSNSNSILEITGSIDIDIFSSTDVSSSNTTAPDKTILNITILVKKGILSSDIKTTIIKINEKTKNYNLSIITKGNTSIYKTVKKNHLITIANLDDKSILYKINECFLVNIDASGFIKYYLDSSIIYNIKDDILNFLELENSINNYESITTSITDFINNPIKLLESCNYKQLYLELNDNSYNINLLDTCKSVNITPNTNDITTIDANTITTNTSNIVVQTEQSTQSGQGLLSNIGYLFSWINPFSYYGSESNITSNINSNITVQNLNNSINTDYVEILNTNTNNENNANNANNANNDILYFIKDNTIAKLYKNKIKLLKPNLLNIPTHIESIIIDETHKITFIGKMFNTKERYNKNIYQVEISFNEFMINQNVEVNIRGQNSNLST